MEITQYSLPEFGMNTRNRQYNKHSIQNQEAQYVHQVTINNSTIRHQDTLIHKIKEVKPRVIPAAQG